jgi:hypothetical protein
MQSVASGQVWSVLDRNGCRVEFTVHRIVRDEYGERRAVGVLASGRSFSFTVSSLSRGSRGARLLRHADGHVPYRPPSDKLALTAEETKTASDYRRQAAPKGVATASPRMEEAYRMRYEKHMSIAEVAKHFAVKPNRVSNWCAQVRSKRLEQRHLKGEST